MPWRISSDLQYFKKVTMNKPVIMGRKTFESIGKPLSGRVNIIITRDINFVAEGAIITNNIDTALKVAKDTVKTKDVKEVMVIGGAQIYQLFLPIANRLYLTEVDSSPEGDVFFPNLNLNDFTVVSKSPFVKEEGDSCSHRLVIYEKNNN